MLSPRIMSDISLESTNYCIASLACEVKTGQRWEHIEGINCLSFRLFAGNVPLKLPLPKFSSACRCWAFNQVKSFLQKSNISTILPHPHPRWICFIIICRHFCWLLFCQVHLSLCSVYEWVKRDIAAGSEAHLQIFYSLMCDVCVCV